MRKINVTSQLKKWLELAPINNQQREENTTQQYNRPKQPNGAKNTEIHTRCCRNRPIWLKQHKKGGRKFKKGETRWSQIRGNNVICDNENTLKPNRGNNRLSCIETGRNYRSRWTSIAKYVATRGNPHGRVAEMFHWTWGRRENVQKIARGVSQHNSIRKVHGCAVTGKPCSRL